MGWCINCHRETNVKSKGNDYYTNLVELHNEKNTKVPMKVVDIGGLNVQNVIINTKGDEIANERDKEILERIRAA